MRQRIRNQEENQWSQKLVSWQEQQKRQTFSQTDQENDIRHDSTKIWNERRDITIHFKEIKGL